MGDWREQLERLLSESLDAPLSDQQRAELQRLLAEHPQLREALAARADSVGVGLPELEASTDDPHAPQEQAGDGGI